MPRWKDFWSFVSSPAPGIFKSMVSFVCWSNTSLLPGIRPSIAFFSNPLAKAHQYPWNNIVDESSVFDAHNLSNVIIFLHLHPENSKNVWITLMFKSLSFTKWLWNGLPFKSLKIWLNLLAVSCQALFFTSFTTIIINRINHE